MRWLYGIEHKRAQRKYEFQHLQEILYTDFDMDATEFVESYDGLYEGMDTE